MTAAYEETRIALRNAAELNRGYYDVRVRPNEYKVGSWVYYYNPKKFKGRQDKWERKYTGPFLVIASRTAKVRREGDGRHRRRQDGERGRDTGRTRGGRERTREGRDER